MNAEKLLSAEATVALTGVIVGDLAGQAPEDRTLPRPRRILSVFLFFGTLSLIASLGPGPARFASAAGGVVALVSLVLGASGRAVIGLLRRGTELAAPTAPSGGSPPAVGGRFGEGGPFTGTGGAPGPGQPPAPGRSGGGGGGGAW